jgi:ABC-2 type transport system permease protein
MRGAFLLESALMITNNLIFFSMWWIFFQQFHDVGGWGINDMAASMAILSGAYGLANICFGGVKNLGIVILSGDLDPFMTQPKNLLIHLIGSKSHSKGWGHIMTAVILISLTEFASGIKLLLTLLLILTGTLILTSFGIIVHSLTFWFGQIESISQKYLDSFFLFSLYPTNIYSGLLQIIMFTLIPAGLIGYIPVELLRNFSWVGMTILLLSSGCLCIFSFFFFHLGLKRYESGNQFGIRL